jgi:MFS family permease
MENIPVADLNSCHSYKRISWSAIIIGALVGVGLGFLLNVFGIAIGLTAFTLSNAGALTLTIGGILGLIVGIIAAMGVAGYVAGYLGRLYAPRRNLGILYGFATWSLALILSAFLAAHLSDYVTSYSEGITKAQLVTQDSDSGVEPASQDNQPNAEVKNASLKVSPSDLAWSAFIVFALFFIGAVSSCVGASCGMVCKHED